MGVERREKVLSEMGLRVVEVLMIAKTTATRLGELRGRLVEMQPYEVPEVVTVRLADGHDAYLRWIAAATRTPLA